MSKIHRSSIEVQGTVIGILSQPGGDRISVTGTMGNFDSAGALIEQWLKIKDTVLFLRIWKRINNPGSISLEFDGIGSEAGRNSFFSLSHKEDRADGGQRAHRECRALQRHRSLDSNSQISESPRLELSTCYVGSDRLVPNPARHPSLFHMAARL
jgi:hypothetical protein